MKKSNVKIIFFAGILFFSLFVSCYAYNRGAVAGKNRGQVLNSEFI